MFGSLNLKIHFVRGLLGFGLLALVLKYSPQLGWWTLLPAAGALLLFGGLPTCWVAGFGATILKRRTKPPAPP